MRRSLALAALACSLAACSGPAPPSRPGPAGPASSAPGLSEAQLGDLRALGRTVLVPRRTGEFDVDGFLADGTGGSAGYSIAYRRADGACFEVNGTTEGLGGPAYPIVEMEATLPALGRRATLYKAAEDAAATSAQNWGPGTVISETVGVDGMFVTFLSASVGGCRPLSLEEAGPIFASLAPLDGPAADGADAWADASDVLDVIGTVRGEDPETAAFAAFATEEEGTSVTVETLRQSGASATLLVTMLNLADDSVKDERFRIEYAEGEGGYWGAVGVQRQVRCWPGRGHPDWGPDPCL